MWIRARTFRRRLRELLVQQMHFQSITSNVTNNKNEHFEVSKPTFSIRFNLLQVCLSVPTFVFVAFLIHSVNLCDHVYVSFNLVAVSTVRILMKFATQLL